MKVALLAGGQGRRLRSLGSHGEVPKPLVPVAGRPILSHVMELFARQGLTDFVVALGAHSEAIRAAVAAGHLGPDAAAWSIEWVDTGVDTATGGRVKRLAPFLGDARFLLAWCDGLASLDVHALMRFHRERARVASVVAVRPPPRFGELDLAGDRVARFREKPPSQSWINGGFFCLEPAAIDLVEGDGTSWERDTLPRLAALDELSAFRHEGFWACMDTPLDRERLEALSTRGAAPWLRDPTPLPRAAPPASGLVTGSAPWIRRPAAGPVAPRGA